MKTASIADVKARFSAHLRDLEKGPLVITRKGRPVGVLLGVQDEDEIERLILGYTPRLRAILEAAEQWIREGEGLSHEELTRQADAESTVAPQPARARARPKTRRSRQR
jgi:prevent-host-death family protein